MCKSMACHWRCMSTPIVVFSVAPINVCSCLQGTRQRGASILVTNDLGQDLSQVLFVEAKHEWGACEGPNTQVQALATYARTASRHLHCPALCETVFPQHSCWRQSATA